MVLVNRMEHLGIPPQIYSTLVNINRILNDLGFPKWILVKWPVPPMMTFWLLLVLLLNGLRMFALFEVLFIIYKFLEEYGVPEWLHDGKIYNGPRYRTRSKMREQSSNRTTTTSQRLTRSDEGEESD